jgi:mannose/cellobiose epimerase-like protein (N-acyl-D-glucosamine 2-epimerase family)
MNKLKQLWSKLFRKPVEGIEIPLGEIHPVRFGMMAEAFKHSEHWTFFKMLCAQIRDENLEPSSDKDVAFARFAVASAMTALPKAVDKLVARKNSIITRQENENNKNLKKEVLGRTHSAPVSS